MPEPTEADVDRLAALMLPGPTRSNAIMPESARGMARRALAAGVALPEPARWELRSVEVRDYGVMLRFEWSDSRDAHTDRPMPKADWEAIKRYVVAAERRTLAEMAEELAEARKGRDEALEAVAAARREEADPDVLAVQLLAVHTKGVFDGLRSAEESDEDLWWLVGHLASYAPSLDHLPPRLRPIVDQARERHNFSRFTFAAMPPDRPAEGGPCHHVFTADEGTGP